MAVRIGFIKVGNIGTSPLLALLLDERADREDIDVRVVSSGAKLTPEQAEEVARKALEFSPSLVIVASPSAGLPGPSKVRAIVKEAGVPGIAISDAPAKKAIKKIEEEAHTTGLTDRIMEFLRRNQRGSGGSEVVEPSRG